MRAPSSARERTSSSSPPSSKRSSSNSTNLHRRASAPAALPTQSVDNGLAICLFGVATKAKMYDAEFEEDRRRRVVMNEVLPDAEMWRKWEQNEAPLRQGRGWYPALDRHFLELLVISEIAALANPLQGGGPPGQPERVHRHAIRVRRVACERIGQERLGAYCDRVKEAFEAYVSVHMRGHAGNQAGWGVPEAAGPHSDIAGWGANDDDEGEEDEDSDEERGRRLSREGSQNREIDEMRGPDRKVGAWTAGGEEDGVSITEVSMGSSTGSGGSESDDEASSISAEGVDGDDDKLGPFADAFMEIDLDIPLAPTIIIHLPGSENAELASNANDGEPVVPPLSPTSDSDIDSDSTAGSIYGGGPEGCVSVRIELDDVDERDEDDIQGDVEMDRSERKASIRVVAAGEQGYMGN